jgi:hypothetical protein
MNPQLIKIPVPNNPFPNRQFCVEFDNALLTHVDSENAYPSDQYVNVIHEGKEVVAGIDKQLQKIGNPSKIYGTPVWYDASKADVVLEDEVFLLYDNAGSNYIHFFFDMFGRCFYYEELLKTNPNLKLGIPEDYYLEDGRSNFIKQWLDLYLEDKNVEIIVFKKNTTYQVKSLITSNLFYWFPEQYGHDTILDMIKKVTDKIEPIEVNSTGAYISRQDTIKRGWYHSRELLNEVEFIEQLQDNLGYDIIEMMDYNLKEKIQLSKSYKTLIQQSSASNINVLFAASGSNSVILSNPQMGPWLNSKCQEFSNKSKSNLLLIDGVGECITEGYENIADKNNYPWELTNIEGLIELLSSIEDGSVWN